MSIFEKWVNTATGEEEWRKAIRKTGDRSMIGSKPYHPANLRLQPYGHWRVIALAWAAKLLGVQFKIGGIPFGGAYRPMPWEQQTMAQQNIANAMAQLQSNMGQQI